MLTTPLLQGEDASKIQFGELLGAGSFGRVYKAVWAGGVCVGVDARHTSQRCSECGQHPKDDETTEHLQHGRVTRDRFICPLCGYEAHADINAARNILSLGRHRWAASSKTAGGAPVAACGGLRSNRAHEAGRKDQGMKRLAA